MGHRATTPNVLRVLDMATEAEWAEGMQWYSEAQALAVELAGMPNGRGDIERAAAVIAILSPMKEWEQNKRLAIKAYESGGLSGGTFRHSVVKVNKLLVDWEEDIDSVVTGPKVRAFWHGIVSGGDTDVVTIDRHAFDVAIGKRLTDDERNINIGMYRACERAYVRAARDRGLSAAQVQAITWTVWRNRYKYVRTRNDTINARARGKKVAAYA